MLLILYRTISDLSKKQMSEVTSIRINLNANINESILLPPLFHTHSKLYIYVVFFAHNIKNMMKQAPENHLKNKYVCSIHRSPIFFTAPHSKRLNRGGKQYGQKLRIHKRQIYTSFLTCDFAKNTGSNSFMFWGVSNLINDTDIDPNYLLTKHFPDSPFHQALHHWALMNQDQPLLHIDIHGKMNRENNCEIDVGIASIDALWQDRAICKKVRQFFDKNGDIFGNMTFKGFQCKFNTYPFLHGYWGGELHTMTTQAVLLGIPSIQFEIPLAVRKKLLRDSQLRGRFHNLIKQLHKTVIVPDYHQTKRKFKLSEQIAKSFAPTPSVKGEKEREEVYEQIARFQTKEEANPNQSKNI